MIHDCVGLGSLGYGALVIFSDVVFTIVNVS